MELGQRHGFCSQKDLDSYPKSWMNLGRLLSLSEPQLPQLQYDTSTEGSREEYMRKQRVSGTLLK